MAPASKSKPVFKTTVPFTGAKWPQLTPAERDDILDLLCSLLQPLGDHRRTYITPSNGKKRKRKSKANQQSVSENRSHDSSSLAEPQHVPPPPPAIGSHLVIGLNSVTRHLEALAAHHAPASSLANSSSGRDEETRKKDEKNPSDTPPSPQPLSVVIIPHSHPPASLSHAHIPTLIHLANPNLNTTSTRLVALQPNSEARLASALHIPHVGALAIKEGAPDANAFVDHVRKHVGLTECAWLDEAMRGEWKATKIDDGR